MSTACLVAFVTTMLFGVICNAEHDDTLNKGLDWRFIISMIIGSVFGTIGLVGITWWAFIIYPLVMMAWMLFTMGLFFLGVIMGVIK